MLLTKSWAKKQEVPEGEQPRHRWTFIKRWHIDCWVANAKHSIEENPRVETRGRTKLPITVEQAVERKKILARHASIVQRVKSEMRPKKCNTERIIHLGGLLLKCKEEIESCGGVPKKW